MAAEFEEMVEHKTSIYQNLLQEQATEFIRETLHEVLGDNPEKFSGVTVQHVRRGIEIATRKALGIEKEGTL